jgi:hypothetical protein
VNPEFEVVITSDKGTVFKDSTETKILTATLYNGTEPITENVGY